MLFFLRSCQAADSKNNKNPMRKPAFIYKVTPTFSSPFSVNILSEAFLYLPLRLILWEHAKITSIGCNTNIHPYIPPGLRALPVHKRWERCSPLWYDSFPHKEAHKHMRLFLCFYRMHKAYISFLPDCEARLHPLLIPFLDHETDNDSFSICDIW